MTDKAKKIWTYALCLWAIATMWAMAPMSIAAGIFVIASLVCVFSWEKRAELFQFIWRSWYGKTTLFLLFVSILSVFAAMVSPPLGISLQEPFELKKVHYFLLPFFVTGFFAMSGRRVEDKTLWRCIWSMALLVSLVTIVQFWGKAFFPASILENRFFRPIPGSERFHGQGLMNFHLSFASAMGFAYSYACARVLWKKTTDSWRVWLGFLLLSLLIGSAIFYSFSRISWLAVIAVPAFLTFLRKPRWGVLLLLVAAVGIGTMWRNDSVFRSRFQEFASTETNGLTGRLIVWRSSLEMIKDRPWTGVGFGKTGQYSEEYSKRYFGSEQWFSSHAHNNMLDAFASTGVFGFLAYLAWWGALIWYSLRQFRRAAWDEKWFPAAGLAAVLAFQINGLTQVNFYDGKSQHALMLWVGLVLASEWQRRYRPSTVR